MNKKVIDLSGSVLSRIPSVVDVKPVGTQVLVEVLSKQEALGTELHIADDAKINGAPQGYVRTLGPLVKTDYGIKAGDRVVLSGSFTPLPEMRNSHRAWILVEPHQIKAILVESNLVDE
jgi:hypothetical protein